MWTSQLQILECLIVHKMDLIRPQHAFRNCRTIRTDKTFQEPTATPI